MMRQYTALLLLAALLAVSAGSIRADDLLTLKNGKEMRCKVRAYSNGTLTIVGQDGKEVSGKLAAIAEIAFDVPPLPIKPSATQKAVSIEKLNTFPEEYVNTRAVFTGCEVDQELEKTRFPDLYAIPITSKGGEYIVPSPKRDGITFVVRKGMAKRMSEDIQGGFNWPNCTLSCTIEKRENYHLAVVDRIDIYNRGGQVGKTYVEPDQNANE